MKLRTTHKIGKGTYVSKTWNTDGASGFFKGLLKVIFYIYYFLIVCLFVIPIKWIISKIKSRKNKEAKNEA